jgi:outer membrane protein TolC
MRMKKNLFLSFSILVLSYAGAKSAKEKAQSPLVYQLKDLETSNESYKQSVTQSNAQVIINDKDEIFFDDYINNVKNYHPDVLTAELEKQIASSKRLETQGQFDPSIGSRNSYNRYNSSSSPGDDQNAFFSDTSFDILTRQGAKFGIGAKYAQGDVKTPFSPTGELGEYYLKLQIPLIRDFINNSANIKEKSAKLNEIIADFVLFRTKLKILENSSNAYWDWFASKKILDVETDLQELISKQVGFVEEQANQGNLPQIAVIEAKRELQSRIGRVNLATRSLQNSAITLSKFLWSAEGAPLGIPNESQLPKAFPQPYKIEVEDIQSAKIQSLKTRPEFKALDLSREISTLEKKLAKNQMLPRLDAYVNQGYEAGDNSIGPVTELGLNLLLPLRVRTAKGQMQQADLKIKQINIQERQLLQNVFMEIEDAASQLNTAYDRYLATFNEFQLSQELEDAEKIIFEQGDSTLFVVIRRQRDRVSANIEMIKALSEYYKALAKYNLVQGNSL